jgi:hypothetical protein
LYENQRRWIGLGWTTSLFAYERGPWTDEHQNPAPAKDDFELPDVEGRHARWRWVDGSEWKIEHGDARQHKRSVSDTKSGSISYGAAAENDGGGWIYYDNKWNDGRRDDGWGRYTRRRKWYRDAELVEVNLSEASTVVPTPAKEGRKGTTSDTEEENGLNVKTIQRGVTRRIRIKRVVSAGLVVADVGDL